MKKTLFAATALAFAGFGFIAPASAHRDVMIMAQQMPVSGASVAATSPVTIDIQMDAATMAALHDEMTGGLMTLSCTPDGALHIICRGK